MSYTASVPFLQRNIRLLQWFNFFEDFRPYTPFVVLYFGRMTGSYALGMSVIALSMVFWSAFEVPTGILSDMVGRVRGPVWPGAHVIGQ